MSSSSSATVFLRAVNSQFDKTMAHTLASLTAMRSSMEAVSRTAKRMLLVGGGAFAFFVKQASDAAETLSMFKAVFKQQSRAAEEWAGVTAKALNRSKVGIQGFMAGLQDTFVPLGFTRQRAMELSKQLTVLGMDLASFKNVAEPETIDLLTSAIVGNHEAVRRFGIILTESTLKQELANMGYGKGKKVVTDLAKVTARINVIMRSTADAQGDAARTSDEFANKVRGLMANAKDLAITLGDSLLPAMRSLVDVTNKIVKPMTAWIQANNEATGAITLHVFKLTGLAAVLAGLIIVIPKMTFVLTGMAVAARAGAVALIAFKAIAGGAGVMALAWGVALGPVLALAAGITLLILQTKEMNRLQERSDYWEKFTANAERDARARRKIIDERNKQSKESRALEVEEIGRGKKREKQIADFIKKLEKQSDTFGMSARQAALFKLGIKDLTQAERQHIMMVEWEIEAKEKAVVSTKKLEIAEKDRANALKDQLERQGDFRDAMNDLIRSLGVAEGWLTDHEVAVERIAEQYGVTVEQAKKFVIMQQRITDLTTKEKEERQAMARIEGPLAVFRRIQAAAATPRAATIASPPSGRSTPAQKRSAQAAEDSRGYLEQILDLFRNVERQLPLAARAG